MRPGSVQVFPPCIELEIPHRIAGLIYIFLIFNFHYTAANMRSHLSTVRQDYRKHGNASNNLFKSCRELTSTNAPMTVSIR